MKTRTVDGRIDRLAAPQHGVVTLADIVGNGITPDQLRARLDRGSLVRLDAGVYRTIGTRRSWEQAVLAACSAAGPQALASHRAAAVLWGLIVPPRRWRSSSRTRNVRHQRVPCCTGAPTCAT